MKRLKAQTSDKFPDIKLQYRLASARAGSKRNADGDPVHNFRTLIDDLAILTRNTVAPRLAGAESFQLTSRPTPVQKKALDLLGVKPWCTRTAEIY